MNPELSLFLALVGFAVLLSLGVSITKDNFYAALFMSMTLIAIATIYAFFAVLPVFILIVFIFIGAIGMITVALAATYRYPPERQISKFWGFPIFIAALFLGFSIYTYTHHQLSLSPLAHQLNPIRFELMSFLMAPEYLILVISLISLIILIMLAVLHMYREGV